jgi:hypothetical protein
MGLLSWARGEAIGEAPMAATETVALPISTKCSA